MRCQQFELYAAEREAHKGRTFGGLDDIQRYVDGLRDTWWWQQWYPQVLRVEVGAALATGKGSVGAWYADKNAGRIEMAKVHWNELFVLHELAHVLADARYGSRAHDPYFARVYLELVSLVAGNDVYRDLYDSFSRAGIEHDADDYGQRLGVARRMGPA